MSGGYGVTRHRTNRLGARARIDEPPTGSVGSGGAGDEGRYHHKPLPPIPVSVAGLFTRTAPFIPSDEYLRYGSPLWPFRECPGPAAGPASRAVARVLDSRQQARPGAH